MYWKYNYLQKKKIKNGLELLKQELYVPFYGMHR